MKLYVLVIAGFVLSAAGCAEKEEPAPEMPAETQTAAPEMPAETQAAAPEAAEAPKAESRVQRSEEFLDHMHAHAEHLDDLNYALADGNLAAAMTPAYWLSRHQTASEIPTEWAEYVLGMREAARAVESAPDLATARAAAERITVQCQGCHAAAGVNTE